MGINFPDTPVLNQLHPIPITPGVPQYRWDGEKWVTATSIDMPGTVRYDTAQGLTANQKAQARSNIDCLKKNYIINGAMMVSQENGSTAGTGAYFAADQWNSWATGAATMFSQQISSPVTPAGGPNRLNFSVNPADTSIAAGDFYFVYQRIEGLRVADLMWGTTAAKTVTLQFGFNGPAGTYGVCVTNSDATRTYLANFIISQAATDTLQTIVIPGDTTGTWKKDNTVGLHVQFTFASGRIGVAGWQGAGSFDAAPGITNNVGTAGPNIQLFDVGLYEGPVAPAFQVPDYASELVLCMRYYQRYSSLLVQGYGVGGNAIFNTFTIFPMRTTPGMIGSGTLVYSNASGLTNNVITSTSIRYNIAVTATGYAYCEIPITSLNARL